MRYNNDCKGKLLYSRYFQVFGPEKAVKAVKAVKNLAILRLADLYGKALTEKQREILSDYYERDFSLSEIAENSGVSRQAVYAALSSAEESVKSYEEKFGFCAFLHTLCEKLSAVKHADGNADGVVEEVLDWIRSNYGTV